MIMDFLKKIPAGIMIAPMFISAIFNTFWPNALQIGSFTTAVFTNQGLVAIIGTQLVCMGAQLRVKEIFLIIRRGGVLLISKFLIGMLIGIAIGKIFGNVGLLGLTSLAVISSVTNGNGSIYLALMNTYGDEVDQGAFSILTLNDGPFFTLVALGASGMANIPFISILAVIIPLAFGIMLGNMDKKVSEFLAPGMTILIPFVGFTIGGSINIKNIVAGGMSGILLGLITLFIGGTFILLCDKFINKRPGYAAWAVATTAGNAIATPAAIALIDKNWTPYVSIATTQVAASAVITAILAPIITSIWVKKYGSPKMPIAGQSLDK